MVACGLPAAAVPLVVDVAGMPGPFEIPLCTFCREPFEAGQEAVERLVWGDPEAVPFGAPAGRCRAGGGAVSEEVCMTEAEAQALHFGSRALREVGAVLTRCGAAELAAESYLSAARLETLGRRARVQPELEQQDGAPHGRRAVNEADLLGYIRARREEVAAARSKAAQQPSEWAARGGLHELDRLEGWLNVRRARDQAAALRAQRDLER
jgi:hypothetical protein